MKDPDDAARMTDDGCIVVGARGVSSSTGGHCRSKRTTHRSGFAVTANDFAPCTPKRSPAIPTVETE
jgi:hypothetical protein